MGYYNEIKWARRFKATLDQKLGITTKIRSVPGYLSVLLLMAELLTSMT